MTPIEKKLKRLKFLDNELRLRGELTSQESLKSEEFFIYCLALGFVFLLLFFIFLCVFAIIGKIRGDLHLKDAAKTSFMLSTCGTLILGLILGFFFFWPPFL